MQGTPTQCSESPAGSGENPGSSRSKEGRRLRIRPQPSLHEANKRSIVVPKVTRTLSRTLSEQPGSCSGQTGPASGAAATGEDLYYKINYVSLFSNAHTKPVLIGLCY